MSAMRKRKPVQANDGSYGGMVLAAFDEMQAMLPIGTRHKCPTCGAEYVCDEDDCTVGHDPVYAAKLQRIDARMRPNEGKNGSNLLRIVQPKTANSGDR